jgi:dihydrodipicolinate synthase/N-acetylneuraminate lyase
MTSKMAEAGVDAALVVTPCFYNGSMAADALESHYIKAS